MAEVQELRRKVVRTFLGYHARYERDVGKWSTILEWDFWLKQPVTPYRSFRRCEIQKVSRFVCIMCAYAKWHCCKRLIPLSHS